MYRHPESAAKKLSHAENTGQARNPVVVTCQSALLPVMSMLALMGCSSASGAFGRGDNSSLFYHNDNVANTETAFANCLDDDNIGC